MQRDGVGNAPGPGLACEHMDLDLRAVKPADLLWRVDPFQTAGSAPDRNGFRARIEPSGLVRVEVVADQGDMRCAGGKCTSSRSFKIGAQAGGVLRAVTTPCRQPVTGVVILHRWAVQVRT